MIRLFRVFLPTSVVALAISEIAVLFSCYISATYLFLLIDVDPEVFLYEEGGFLRISIVVAVLVAGFYFNDLYTQLHVRSRMALVQQVCLVLGIAFLMQALLSYGSTGLILPRRVMVYGSAMVLVLVPLWRMAYSKIVEKAIGSERVLFLGSSEVVRELVQQFGVRRVLGVSPIGYVDDAEDAVPGIPHLGRLEEFAEVVARHQPNRIVVGMSERRSVMPVRKMLEVRLSGIMIEEAAQAFETAFGRVNTKELRPSQLIFSSEVGPSPNSLALQSIYSWIIAAAGTVVTLPLMVLAAILVRLSSPGPVLLRQVRVGLNGKNFTVYKFRSMYQDAEARTGAVWATKNDPRITPIGRFLRKFRLDELPQFFNVLRGDMAIVGPRPERPEFVKALTEQIPYYRQRHCVKPGITGWAQINHGYTDTVEDTIVKLEYDLYYIKYISPSLDLYIILNTFKTMLLSHGAQ